MQHYEQNVEDIKKDRLYFEIGIDAQKALRVNNYSSASKTPVKSKINSRFTPVKSQNSWASSPSKKYEESPTKKKSGNLINKKPTAKLNSLDEANHLKWTSYVKFFDSNLNIIDIRKFIKKVRFSLDREYDQGQYKEVTEPSPQNTFEFSAQGYKQFSMMITIYF